MIGDTYKPIIVKLTKSHIMNDNEYEALINIGHEAKQRGIEFVETYCKGKVMVLDTKFRSQQNFHLLSDEDMTKAYDNQMWSYIVQE